MPVHINVMIEYTALNPYFRYVAISARLEQGDSHAESMSQLHLTLKFCPPNKLKPI